MTGLIEGDNLFLAHSLEDISLEAIQAAVKSHTFACIRGLVETEPLLRSLEKLTEVFDMANDYPAIGNSPDAVRSNFQKLNAGGETLTANNDDAKLVRTFYNPIWADDIYGMRESFIKLAEARNWLAGRPKEYATHNTEPDGLWTAARLHQYPSGGGFFRRHTDYVVREVLGERSADFFQVVLTISEKGKHYETGGAFVDFDGKRINIDDYTRTGDIIIYDGRTVHGVEDIDGKKLLDLTTINGRVAGFATLYRKL